MYLGTRKVDLVGDVHGCYSELLTLLDNLGYQEIDGVYSHPEGRTVVFIGDLVSRGPLSLPVLDLAMKMRDAGNAFVLRGNNEDKFLKYLKGETSKIRDGMQLEILSIPADKVEERLNSYREFIESLPLYLFWGGTKEEPSHIFVHAAWKPEIQDWDPAEKEFYCTYGPMGTIPCKYGYCLVQDWVYSYPEDAPICVMGHTPFSGKPYFNKNTVCIDTAAVFGGHLSSYSLPEGNIVQVKSKEYWPVGKLLSHPHYDPHTPK